MLQRLIIAPLILLTAVASILAYSGGTASLTGRVSDIQSSPVVGARVRLTDQMTGRFRETLTNADGSYLVASIPAGAYTVSVSGQGFSERRFKDLDLHVGQTTTLDVELHLAGPEQSVTVVQGIDSNSVVRSSAIDEVIRPEEVERMPLNGRNFLELALLTPGNAPAPNFDPTKTNTVLISSAGQLGRGGSLTIDGLDNTDDVVGGPLQNISQEAVLEFRMATSRFSAESGRSASSVVSILTKSGANELHGSASAYFRDRRLQGLPATLDRRVVDELPFDRQQYAFSVGGPFVKDRAWWFGSMEYRNQDGALVVGERDPATRTIRRGLATAPLNDFMATVRGDVNLSEDDQLSLRYSNQTADDTTASTLIRSIGSASQRQKGANHYHSLSTAWTRVISPVQVNSLTIGDTRFRNRTDPVTPGPQLTFPSLQDGASFRVPQQTRQNRFQVADTFDWMVQSHHLRMGGEYHRVDAEFTLDVFREGRIEFVQDFPDFDHNGDGTLNDEDLLFAVSLRSAFPDRSLVLPDSDNDYFGFFVQDDWRITPQFSLNLGLRYELDTDVKNISRIDELNPLVTPFLQGRRGRDTNNWAPRIGFSWGIGQSATIRGGYGIYYDKIVLQIQSLERGLDGRALPVEVRAGNLLFLDPQTGTFPQQAPSLSNPFTGFLLPGEGAAGINIIDNRMQNPMVQQFNLGVQWRFAGDLRISADALHALGTHFIIGRRIGQVFNPVVEGPDFVVNLESSVNTKYDGLLVDVVKPFSGGHQFRAAYTLSKTFNYGNDDQIPFANGPVNPNNLQLEYGPTPNDQRHRLSLAGAFQLPGSSSLSLIWTMASAVPMDILMPDGRSRIPLIQRNAGGRLFTSAAELNSFLQSVNDQGGIGGVLLPLAREDARFNDSFNSLDLRLSRAWNLKDRFRIIPTVEVFNLLNTTNVLGVSNLNYSGFSNVLVRDSENPSEPGYLVSSGFGRPVTTAGGVFGSGGPRAFQFAVRVGF